MRTGPRIVVVAMTVGLTGCGTTSAELELVRQLVGDWVWIESTGGIAGLTLTPSTEGYDESLRFYASEEVELFRDGVSQRRTGFTYFVGPEGSSENLAFDEPLFGFESAIAGITPGDTLILIDPCCDGFVRRWVR